MEQSRLIQYLVTFCVSLAFVSLGVTSTWPSPVLPKFHNNETSVDISKEEISWMMAIYPVGFIAGSLVTRYISDYMGRRITILGSACPIAMGMLIVTFAKAAWLLYITAFLWNFGTGMLSTVIGIYMAEIVDKEIRGTLSVCTRFSFNLGVLLVLCIGPYISYETINYCMLPLPFCYFAACWWIPESPYYYLKEGKVDAARKQFIALKCCKDERELDELLLSKQEDLKKEMERSSSTKELFTGKQYRKALIISSGLKLTQIFTGGVTIKQYLGFILLESNIPEEYKGTVFIIFGAVAFIVGIMSSILVDRVGRRPLLIWSYFGTGLSLAVVSVYFYHKEYFQLDKDSMTGVSFIPFVGIVISNVLSTLGFGTLGGIIPAEIFPLNVKAVAMTSLGVFGGVLGFAVGKSFQDLCNLLGYSGIFSLYALVAIVGGCFSYFVVPETKGKDLREIQLMLEGDVGNDAIKLNQFEVNEEKPLQEVLLNNETKNV